MNSITPYQDNSNPLFFYFEGHPIRIVKSDTGKPLFIAKDLCDTLELDNVSKAISRLDEDEFGYITLSNVDGIIGKMIYLTESGMYSLILSSRKPIAKPFKRWVTHEVLPQILATGSYNQQPMSQLDLAQQTLNALVAQDRELKALASEVRLNKEQTDGHLQSLDHDVNEIKVLYPDMYTVAGYFLRIGRKAPNTATLKALSGAAKKQSDRTGMLMRSIYEGNNQFPTRTYHETVLHKVVADWDVDNDNKALPSKQMKF